MYSSPYCTVSIINSPPSVKDKNFCYLYVKTSLAGIKCGNNSIPNLVEEQTVINVSAFFIF